MTEPESTTAITRRRLLEGGAGVAAGVLLAGCGGGGESSTTGPKGPPRRGGQLRVGMIGGGEAETVDPAKVVGPADTVRAAALYDHLFVTDANLRTVPHLVESAEPDASQKMWTIRLRSGVTFHNGKPLTSDDLLHTLTTWTNPQHFVYSAVGNAIVAAGLRKRDKLTVEVPLFRPNARFPDALVGINAVVIPSPPNGKPPIGTGPFAFKSFTPGKSSLFTANRDYWLPKVPYVDELIVNSSFSDETARLNALLANEIDVLPLMQYAQAKAQLRAGKVNVLQSPSTAVMYFYMRVDKPPFNDVRVRQAMRLLADRAQLVDQVFNGFGRPSSDLWGRGTPFFADDLVRTRDVEQAKSLLKQAGQENLTVTLHTSPVAPGFVESATILAVQAKDAGVKINIVKEDPGQYFSTLYLKESFAQAYLQAAASLALQYDLTCVPHCVFWETRWNDPKSVQLLHTAEATSDKPKATRLWHEYQEQQFNEGGYLIWGEPYNLDAAGKHVGGLVEGKQANLNNWDFKTAWLAS